MMNLTNEQRTALYQHLLQHPFKLDDTFRFRCTACGKCCKDRQDILLSPYDLNRMARYLRVEMGELIQTYCVCHEGCSSHLPVVTLDMRGQQKKCPFLERKKCRIHAAKPTVCALFPLGRVGSEDHDSVQYILQDVDCGDRDEEHSVREWLGVYGLEESEIWFNAWNKATVTLAKRMNPLAEKLTAGVMNPILQGLLVTLYVQYDMEKDFMEQFIKNVQKANEMLDGVDALVNAAGTLIK